MSTHAALDQQRLLLFFRYIEGCDVALGNRTVMLSNYAHGAQAGSAYALSSTPGGLNRNLYTGANNGPAYAAKGLNGNSIYSTNGTLRYILPAPLGHWVGPTRESQLYEFGLVASETLSVVIKASNVQEYNPMDRKEPDKRINLAPDFRIDEDFPWRCVPGFFREQDTPEAQDGPQCEAACPAGSYCPAGTATPLNCHQGSYCLEGSEVPVPCPKGTWTNHSDVRAPWECEPCPRGFYCPLNTSTPIACGLGHFAPTVGYYECAPCPIGYFQDGRPSGLFGHTGDSGWADGGGVPGITADGHGHDGTGFGQGQANCSACIEGIYCPLGTTKEPCYPGEYRDLDSGNCKLAPVGYQASLGATLPTLCPAGTHGTIRRSNPRLTCHAATAMLL